MLFQTVSSYPGLSQVIWGLVSVFRWRIHLYRDPVLLIIIKYYRAILMNLGWEMCPCLVYLKGGNPGSSYRFCISPIFVCIVLLSPEYVFSTILLFLSSYECIASTIIYLFRTHHIHRLWMRLFILMNTTVNASLPLSPSFMNVSLAFFYCCNFIA